MRPTLTDDDVLHQLCGSDDVVAMCKTAWAQMVTAGKLDVSDKGLTDEKAERLLKGLHMCATPQLLP